MEEKRKKEDQIRKSKSDMIARFEKIAQKARRNKDNFYREIFTPVSMAVFSIKKYNLKFYRSIKFRRLRIEL
jgi:hypothetical protein